MSAHIGNRKLPVVVQGCRNRFEERTKNSFAIGKGVRWTVIRAITRCLELPCMRKAKLLQYLNKVTHAIEGDELLLLSANSHKSNVL